MNVWIIRIHFQDFIVGIECFVIHAICLIKLCKHAIIRGFLWKGINKLLQFKNGFFDFIEFDI